MMKTDSYKSILQKSIHVNWQIEDILNKQQKLNFNLRFLPETLASVDKISCLNDSEKLLLNQIRANSYCHIFRVAEEFVLPAVIHHVDQRGLEDIVASQALLHFAEEEAKHIDLFRHLAAELEQGFGFHCGVIGPVADIARAVMQHHPLGVILVILYIEWMTQEHYLDMIHEDHGKDLDPEFCRVLKYHWLEEAQHAELDILMVKKLVNILDTESINQGVEDFFKIVELLHGGFMKQMQLDLESLSSITGRMFSDSEIEEIASVQQKSYEWTFIGSGLTHRNFLETFQEVSPSQMERLKAFSQQYC